MEPAAWQNEMVLATLPRSKVFSICVTCDIRKTLIGHITTSSQFSNIDIIVTGIACCCRAHAGALVPCTISPAHKPCPRACQQQKMPLAREMSSWRTGLF